MPESIVWYSQEELEYYHTCWNCYRRKSIHGENLEIATATEALGMELAHCPDCITPRLQGTCKRVFGVILGNGEN